MRTLMIMLCTALLFASSGFAQAKPKVLLLKLVDTGAGDDETKTINGVMANELEKFDHLELLSGTDLEALANIENERHMAGCDKTSCLVELALAMGSRYVIFGEAGRLGSLIVINLSLLDADNAENISRVSLESESLEQVPRTLRAGLHPLTDPLKSSNDIYDPAAVAPPVEKAPASIWPATAGWTGVGLGVLGAVLLLPPAYAQVSLRLNESQFRDGNEDALKSASDAQDLWYGSPGLANIFLIAGSSLVVVGGALAVTGFALSAGE